MSRKGSVALMTYSDTALIRTYAFYTSASTTPAMAIVLGTGHHVDTEYLDVPNLMYKYGDVELDLELGDRCAPVTYGRVSKNWKQYNPVWHSKVQGTVINNLFTDFQTGEMLRNVGTDSCRCHYTIYDTDKVTPMYEVNKVVTVSDRQLAMLPWKLYEISTVQTALRPGYKDSYGYEIGLSQSFTGTYDVLHSNTVWVPKVMLNPSYGSWPNVAGPSYTMVASDNSFKSLEDAKNKAWDKYFAFSMAIHPTWDGVTYHSYIVNRARVSSTGHTVEELTSKIVNSTHPEWGLVNTLTKKGQPYSVLAGKAMQDIGMANNNGIAYLKDTARMSRDLSDEATQLSALVRKMQKSKAPSSKINAAVKAAASTYLSMHYGWKLQAEDTRQYKKALDQAGRSFGIAKSSAQYSGSWNDWSFTQRYSLYYDNVVEERDMLVEFLKYIDLWPTSENVWDMVPYSFVIDWFTGIGDILHSLDNYYHVANRYKIIGNIRTMTAWRELNPFKGTGIQCDLQQKLYARGTYNGALIPSFIGDVSIPSKFNHYIEGGTLIVQRIP